MAYGHRYPWQWVTRRYGLSLGHRLASDYDVARLQSELAEILADYSPQTQHGGYHDGGWEAIGLIALNGDYREDRPVSDAHPGEYRATEVLDGAPHMREIIESFPAPKKRVRLMRMAPGAHIYWHFDRAESLDSENARLHVPIVTSRKILFQIAHEDFHWEPGSLWYGDFSFPHRLWNQSDEDRIHLVIDLEANDALRAMLPDVHEEQKDARASARRACAWLYNAAHPSNLRGYLPRSVGRALRSARAVVRAAS